MNFLIQDPRCVAVIGDSRAVLAALPECSVDAVVTDPPAGIEFMNKSWDGDRGGRDAWVAWLAGIMREVYRVLKPGGHALVWAIPQTSHWTAWALEEAGFPVRDRISYWHAKGFPHGVDITKMIDKHFGKSGERPVIGANPNHRPVSGVEYEGVYAGGNTGAAELTAAATPEAAAWSGWHSALRPACEDWWLVRKPLEGTYAENVLAHGTGALNIAACRVGTDDTRSPTGQRPDYEDYRMRPGVVAGSASGRWPMNVALAHAEECVVVGTATSKGHRGYPNGPGGNGFHGGPGRDPDGSRVEVHDAILDATVDLHACVPWCPVRLLDQQAPRSKSKKGKPRKSKEPGEGYGMTATGAEYDDAGGVSRYFPVFYGSKASTKDREYGCAGLPARTGGEATDRVDGSAGLNSPRAGAGRRGGRRNVHPTIKDIGFTRWLCRLITPPGGTILDPFAGSGTTGVAALHEGFKFIGVELGGESGEYAPILEARLQAALRGDPLP